MKLMFPNGEHTAVLLGMGLNRIGSDPDGSIVLALPGVLPRHFEIHVTTSGANLQLPEGGGLVTVNGRVVKELMALRTGDLLGFGALTAKFIVIESTRMPLDDSPSLPSHASAAQAVATNEDIAATRVRIAPPRFVLRGVSGSAFGKMYGITGSMSIGRSAECDISIPVEEISRRHALVKPNAEGLQVEDLDSSNGTYINNKRVQSGQLLPGDELRLDQVRLILVAPGLENQPKTPAVAVAADDAGRSGLLKIVASVVIVGSFAFIVWLMLGQGV